MKLIIQIPSCHEADSLPVALAALPRPVDGFEKVGWLVIDDGSMDQTGQIVRRHSADHVVRHARNCSLTRAFMTGLDASLRRSASPITHDSYTPQSDQNKKTTVTGSTVYWRDGGGYPCTRVMRVCAFAHRNVQKTARILLECALLLVWRAIGLVRRPLK